MIYVELEEGKRIRIAMDLDLPAPKNPWMHKSSQLDTGPGGMMCRGEVCLDILPGFTMTW